MTRRLAPGERMYRTSDGRMVSETERILAARVRVIAERNLGRETAPWIVELSQQPLPRRHYPEAERQLAARVRVAADKTRGIRTPDWIVELAGKPRPLPEKEPAANFEQQDAPTREGSRRASRARVAAAKLRVRADQQLGEITPAWIVELAGSRRWWRS